MCTSAHVGAHWLCKKTQGARQGPSVRWTSYLDHSLKHVSQRQEGDEHIVLSRKDHFLQVTGMGDRKERNTDRKTTRESKNNKEKMVLEGQTGRGGREVGRENGEEREGR